MKFFDHLFQSQKKITPKRSKKKRLVFKHAQIKTHYFIRKTVKKAIETFWVKGDISTWFYGLLIGICVGYLALFFRLLIQSIQYLGFHVFSENLVSELINYPLYWFFLISVIGGILISGLLYIGKKTKWLIEEQPLGISEVMEARIFKSGKIKTRSGLYSALISATALGFGASTGREGPAVHLGASFTSILINKLKISPRIARALLACGSAAAVSASFNAPLAGIIFALELILGHYALRVIAPVTISSVTASLVVRTYFGANPIFLLPDIHPNSLYDFPASIFLGILSALLAIIFIKWALYTPRFCTNTIKKFHLPTCLLPVFGGLCVGCIAIFFPEILGVGYETTSNALAGVYSLSFLLLLIPVKTFISGWCIGCRFGTGVFSPSIYLGALLGLAFGILMTFLPGITPAGKSFYAIIGMGALSGAVLGAPISTTLIIFELTSSYETTIAVMVAVSIATMLVQTLMGGNFFQKQMISKGLPISGGTHYILLKTIPISQFIRRTELNPSSLDENTVFLYQKNTLGDALNLFNAQSTEKIYIKSDQDSEKYIGYITLSETLSTYSKALIEDQQERSM